MEQTARAHTYTLLKDAILEGRYKPGEPLREEHLAQEFGVSRTPIRQAFQTLADEGLIETGANKRTHVTDIDAAALEEMLDIQGMMESYSVALAARRMTDQDIEDITAIQQKLEDDYFSGEAKDDRLFLLNNSLFHRAIHKCSGNPRLFDMVKNLVEIPAAAFIKFGRLTDSEESIFYHRKIVEALDLRDPELARLHMNAHIETVRRECRNLMRQSEAS